MVHIIVEIPYVDVMNTCLLACSCLQCQFVRTAARCSVWGVSTGLFWLWHHTAGKDCESGWHNDTVGMWFSSAAWMSRFSWENVNFPGDLTANSYCICQLWMWAYVSEISHRNWDTIHFYADELHINKYTSSLVMSRWFRVPSSQFCILKRQCMWAFWFWKKPGYCGM